MRFISYAMIILVWLACLWIAIDALPERHKVNCSLVGISPDVAPEVQQACQEKMRHKL